MHAWPDFVCVPAVLSPLGTKEVNRPNRRLQLQPRESGVRCATRLFPQLYEMPNRAEGSQEATATAIIAVCGLDWAALTLLAVVYASCAQVLRTTTGS